MIRWLSLVILFLILGHANVSPAQDLPVIDLVFDDFRYGSSAEMFGETSWTTRHGLRQETGWYKQSWEGRQLPPDVSVEPLGDRVSLVAGTGFRTTYDSLYPPEFTTGLTARRGTWASRVRFGKLDTSDRAPMVFAAFWLMAPYYALSEADRRSGWYEINYEWTNANPTTGRPSHPTLSMGAMIDGTSSSDMMEHGVTGGFPFRASSDGQSANWSCLEATAGGGFRYQPDAEACASHFKPEDGSALGPYVTLLFQYDDTTLTYSAMAEDPSTGAIRVKVIRKERVDRVLGDMVPYFSIITDGRHGLRQPVEMEVDWFLFSPETRISLTDVIETVDSLRNEGLSRINTTGLSLSRPEQQITTVTLLPPDISRTVHEWVALPGIKAQSTGYNFAWSSRTRTSPSAAWSDVRTRVGGHTLPIESFTEGETQPHAIEVRVGITDRFEYPAATAISECWRFYPASGATSTCLP
jgi:hypothetical protein